MMSFGALIQGHAHPKIVEVVSHTMADGSHFAAATSAEVEAAERLRRMVPSAEVVRFTNTGSEATMLALRLARAHTRRTKFLKFEGHYHGWYDPYLLNAHSHPLRSSWVHPRVLLVFPTRKAFRHRPLTMWCWRRGTM